MRKRAMGSLFVLSGVFFAAGVLDPPILPTWGGSATAVMATASAHRTAWFASTWLIALSITAEPASGRGPRPHPRHGSGPGRQVTLSGRERARPRVGNVRPVRNQHTARHPRLPTGTWASSTGL